MMCKKSNGKETVLGLARTIGLLLLLALLPSCQSPIPIYIPGLIEPSEAQDPPAPGAVQGESEIFYGKFILFQVGGGKISKLGDGKIDYFVGDEFYLPSNNATNAGDYNINHGGDEDALTFHYKDVSPVDFAASGRPEALTLDRELTLFYTHPATRWSQKREQVETSSGGDVVGGDTSTAYPMGLSAIFYGMYNYMGDVDVYALTIAEPQTMVSIQGRYTQFNSASNADVIEARHRMRLRLMDVSGTVRADSRNGLDFWKYLDPDLTVVIQDIGTYYLEVSDVQIPLQNNADYYRILIEAGTEANVGKIMKGEIQPARSGNPHLRGGATFEPDDLSTLVEDLWPDCDGIPGSGDEGDAGINELCGSYNDFGANDGKMEYQEVDDKTAIDDGEYFVGQPTNVPAFIDSEVSIVKTPDADSLLMFISYGSGIYLAESLDGETGLDWDLSNILNDRPAVAPLQQRSSEGNHDTPVVTSGKLGFCETVPALGDNWGAPEMADYARLYGTTPTATGKIYNVPIGYPNTSAITFGSNGHLDSEALVDDLVGNTISSGEDGIVNTFFAPRYVAYFQFPVVPPNTSSRPIVLPGNTISTYGLNGPGNPDNPSIYDSNVNGYVHPLFGGIYGGDDRKAFLLGDDEWNPAIFRGDTLTPAAYFRKQGCHFYIMGRSFDRCAYGVPEDENGEEPVEILPGRSGQLDTVDELLRKYRGDDELCHQTVGDTTTVAICPGPDGRFGWQDVYIPLQGDDRLQVVLDTTTPDPTDLTVGIGPGPNGTLETPMGNNNNWKAIDLENLLFYFGGDVFCSTLDGHTAICAGNSEFTVNIYNNAVTPTGARRLMTIWPMYITSPSFPFSAPTFLMFTYLLKKDLYGAYDDELCAITPDGDTTPTIAICPGKDGVFQSYPLRQRVIVDQDDDLFTLHDRIKDQMSKECYSLQAETYKDDFSEKDKVRYVLYHDMGVRQDDRVRWDSTRGWFVTTGRNGINQSCVAKGDEQLIPKGRGLPNRPIIVPGADGVFQTYALADEKIEWAKDVNKISTGADGVSNSYAVGDDRLEVFLGTGRPDHPCVRSNDGIASTAAQNYNLDASAPIWANDTQVYRPGEKTGFDAYRVFGPKAAVVNKKIYLYYSALGWEEAPEFFRDSAGSLGDAGECRHPGLDNFWGRRNPDYSLIATDPDRFYKYDLKLFEKDFKRLLDNNGTIFIAPRIGLAISDIKRLRVNTADWDLQDKPVLDLGQQCAGLMDFPIDLGLGEMTLAPDINYNGAFSPEIEFTENATGDRLFLMFFSGLSENERDGADVNAAPKSQIGLARSLDGKKWEMIRGITPVIAPPEFDILAAFGSPTTQYATPSIYNDGKDEFGEPMYGMFFNQFELNILSSAYDSLYVDFRSSDHIGWALRRGKSSISSCALSSDRMLDDQERNRRVLQLVILAIPVALAGIIRFGRRGKKA